MKEGERVGERGHCAPSDKIILEIQRRRDTGTEGWKEEEIISVHIESCLTMYLQLGVSHVILNRHLLIYFFKLNPNLILSVYFEISMSFFIEFPLTKTPLSILAILR